MSRRAAAVVTFLLFVLALTVAGWRLWGQAPRAPAKAPPRVEVAPVPHWPSMVSEARAALLRLPGRLPKLSDIAPNQALLPPVPLEQYEARFVDAFCSLGRLCLGNSSEQDCRRVWIPDTDLHRQFELHLEAVRQGRMHFDGQVAARNLADLGLRCRHASMQALFESAFTGAAPLGAGCNVDAECAGRWCRVGLAGPSREFEGVCSAPLGEGRPCQDHCQSGLACIDSVCVPELGERDGPCRGRCPEDQWCDLHPPARPCPGQSDCLLPDQGPRCRNPVGLDELCNFLDPHSCQPGLRCPYDLCMRPRGEGEFCSEGECAEGLVCGSTRFQRKCQKPQPLGGTCWSDHGCDEIVARCVGAGRGRPGTCARRPALGEPCVVLRSYGPFFVDDCQDPALCDPDRHVCVQLPAEGEPCVAGRCSRLSQLHGLICVADRCRYRLRRGAACEVGEAAVPCEAGYHCAHGRCASGMADE